MTQVQVHAGRQTPPSVGWESSAHLLELLDPFQHLPVLIRAEVVIRSAEVPWVQGVVANDVEGLFRQTVVVSTEHPVEVLVMAPRRHHLFQTAVLPVHSKTSAANTHRT